MKTIFSKVKEVLTGPVLRSAAPAGELVAIVGLGTLAWKGVKAVVRVGQALLTKKVV